jgi:GNAT superfamily N-acetyltransferase
MAHSELPSGIAARPLEYSDLDSALSLSQEAGWNQVAADWKLFLEFGAVICLQRGDRVIATAATLPYGGAFAWISMVLVTAAERHQGLARWLLQRCVEDLCARHLVPVLDATPAGRAVYLGLGFRDRWTLHRVTSLSPRISPRKPISSAILRPISPADWPHIIAYDARVFGAERGFLLRSLAARLPNVALIAEAHGGVAGYLLSRDGRVMNQLGPVVAENKSIAADLLDQAIRMSSPPLAVDVPDYQTHLTDWLTRIGFAAQRPLTRMAYQTNAAFDDGSRTFAIAGPELG